MQRTRVLVVDDSVVFRVMASRLIRGEADLDIADVAANGRIALEKIRETSPDLVVLDVEMPELNGLDTLVEIRKEWPDLPVIICSTQTQAGAATVVEALFRGANECIAKPSAGAGDKLSRLESLKENLLSSIRSLAAASRAAPSGRVMGRPNRQRVRPSSGSQVVVIGSSTGGPGALNEVFSMLPVDFHLPIVVVQHMPAVFTRRMAERLNERAALTVREAYDGATLCGREVWIAPGGVHTVIRTNVNGEPVLRLTDGPPVQSCRPSVDTLFLSAVDVWGSGVLAVVLTGMGKDGTGGCRGVREVGGQVVVQDALSSVVWGMPRAVVEAGLHDAVLPLSEIATEVLRRSGYQHGSAHSIAVAAGAGLRGQGGW